MTEFPLLGPKGYGYLTDNNYLNKKATGKKSVLWKENLNLEFINIA